jgi:hypothetical protein
MEREMVNTQSVSNEKLIEIASLARLPDDRAQFKHELTQLVPDDIAMVMGVSKLLNDHEPFIWTTDNSENMQRFIVLAKEIGATYRDSVSHPLVDVENMPGPETRTTSVAFFPPAATVIAMIK